MDRLELSRMHAHAALAEFRQLKRVGRLTPEVATRLATGAASAFLSHYAAGGGYLGETIALLCEMATLHDQSLSQVGLHGLFPLLVERLGDAFEPAACALYDRLFVQVIQHCRRLPGAEAIDTQLRGFGLVTGDDLLGRAARVRELRRFDRRWAARIEKAFVLSRVTLGADVAVTSVVLAKLKQVCPHAKLLLLASSKTQQLFAGDSQVCLCPIEYGRGGGLIERLASWLRVAEAIQRETADLEASEYLIVDPDSRLTQLGLFPLMADECPYYFFESRSYCAPGLPSISELTAHWLQQVFGTDAPVYPYFAPSGEDVAFAKTVVAAVKALGRAPVVSVNLGVGANPLKRLPDPFEHMLLNYLLRDGAVVILDRGGEEEERARIETLTAALRGKGAQILALDTTTTPGTLAAEVGHAHLITWQGGIGRFGALVGESDGYIGYDSAGQHLAAALGIPAIDIFTGFSSPRMPDRWHPHGWGPVRMLVVESGQHMTGPALDALVTEVLHAVHQLRKR
ncbi:MAG: glycosyltransferase family 9 protein [Nitrospinae bacterium]|nr:glycosyltransferase family 9 protein [Nitrospinota bacterium]